jgi:hypothetical protein
MLRLLVLVVALAAASLAAAQDLARIVTRADVEKVTGQKFKEGVKPMPSQISFSQEGGDLTVSVEVEPREASKTVRGWEATMKTMQPSAKVETVPGVGKDAIFYGTRADLGAVDADFDSPRVQMRVAVAGAKTPAEARKIVVDLARTIGPRVGK